MTVFERKDLSTQKGTKQNPDQCLNQVLNSVQASILALEAFRQTISILYSCMDLCFKDCMNVSVWVHKVLIIKQMSILESSVNLCFQLIYECHCLSTRGTKQTFQISDEWYKNLLGALFEYFEYNEKT